MLPVLLASALLVLVLITWAGIFALQRLYPAQGEMIEVAGAVLNVVDIGPRDGWPGAALSVSAGMPQIAGGF